MHVTNEVEQIPRAVSVKGGTVDTYKLNVNKVRTLSLNKGMSVSKVCEKAGMSRSRVTDWKNRSVTPSTVYRIAQVLNVEPEELVITEVE